jgi:predicted small lipoprotein YifL
MRIALILTLLLGCAGLSACGQKGPLFIPPDTAPPPQQQPAPAQD